MSRMTKERALAARKSWQEKAETWRAKIQTAKIIEALDKHVRGDCELKATQVKAAQVLLDRVMPTLSASEITKKNEVVNPQELIQMLRERYGNEFADKLAQDYVPQHEAGHA